MSRFPGTRPGDTFDAAVRRLDDSIHSLSYASPLLLTSPGAQMQITEAQSEVATKIKKICQTSCPQVPFRNCELF
jgi:hypothetical protein